MEKIFKARWWDYSNKRFNINGRVCLEVMVEFGIMGTLALYFLQPQLVNFIGMFSYNTKLVFVTFIFIIYVFDTLISLKVMRKIKVQIKKQKEDNTEAIKKQVTEWINEHSFINILLEHSLNLRFSKKSATCYQKKMLIKNK